MHYGPLKYLPRTLRFRLTFWNTIGILVLVSGALWGVREGLRWALLNELDAELAEDINEVKLTLDAFWPKWEDFKSRIRPKVISHSDRDWFVRVYSTSDELLWSSDGAPDLHVPKARSVRSGAYNWQNYRLLQRPIAAGKQTPGRVVVYRARTLAASETERHRVCPFRCEPSRTGRRRPANWRHRGSPPRSCG